MKIAFACDHRGIKLKLFLIDYLRRKKHKIYDFGTHTPESCDYPDYIYPAAKAVSEKKVDRGIVLCFTGIGASITANKVKGVRAALVDSVAKARFSRKHNNSNVLALSAGFIDKNLAKRIVSVWLKTEFEGGRHLRRIKKIEAIEQQEGSSNVSRT